MERHGLGNFPESTLDFNGSPKAALCSRPSLLSDFLQFFLLNQIFNQFLVSAGFFKNIEVLRWIFSTSQLPFPASSRMMTFNHTGPARRAALRRRSPL
jgi:hypothetical protein